MNVPSRSREALRDSTGLFIKGVKPDLKLRDYRLIAFDMDSTLVDIECIDEIADVVGKGPQVQAITEAAMRGEISRILSPSQRA